MQESSNLPSLSPFLQQVADALLNAWTAEGFRNAAVFFPSTRARLFFTKHIASRLATQTPQRPCWMPTWGSIPSLFEAMAGMAIVEPMMLIPQLHRIFLKHYTLTTDDANYAALDDLNNFYYWGNVLLHDFAQIDLYRCDAQQLFANIDALKQIDDAFDYLTDDQKKVLKDLFDFEERKKDLNQFFNVLKADNSTEQNLKQRFVSIWRILWPVYHDLCLFMEERKIGYSAHVSRCAIERLEANQIDEETLQRLLPPRIAFAGFNALNRCEQALFDFIEKRYKLRGESALFFWNYSQAMLDDSLNEAGLFMRKHMALQHIDVALSPATPSSQGEWQIYAAPSTLAQVSILANTLQKQIDGEGSNATSNTAIVLADENLLLPLLRTLPAAIERCNVTMGYPLRNTLVYSVMKSYLQLLSTHDSTNFSYSRHALVDFLSHPYTASLNDTDALRNAAANTQNDRANATLLNAWPYSALFLPALGISDPIAAAQRLLTSIANALNKAPSPSLSLENGSEDLPLDTDHILTAFTILDTLRESLNQAQYPYIADETRGINPCDVARTLLLLLPTLFRDAKADFYGEPLEGLQIMGFLETRTLDFDTIYILSANDDFLPRVANAPSFIPRSLQRAFGLPTRSDHEAMYAYYFDTITMRAKRIVIIYTLGGEFSEPSRYILQRKYSLKPINLHERKTALPSPKIFSSESISIEKSPKILARLADYLTDSATSTPKSLSPSSLNAYIDCPLKFYFSKIAGIAPPQTDPKENFDQRIFGTCVHAALETLYQPLIGSTLSSGTLNALASPANVQKSVRSAFVKALNYPPTDTNASDLPLRWRIYLRSTERYIESILKTDIKRLARIDSIIGLEYSIAGKLSFTDSHNNLRYVRLGGTIDRLDRLKNNSGVEIIDYKTGAFRREHAIYVGNEHLTAQTRQDHGYQLQILLYALLLTQDSNFADKRISAGLWFPRCRDANFSVPGLFYNETTPFEFNNYDQVLEKLPSIVGKVLSSLFDSDTPFTQREHDRTCDYCDFRMLCNR